MIRRLQVRGYRALRAVDVELRDFQVLVGPNASGKTTLFDVLLLLRDIIRIVGVDAPLEPIFRGDAALGLVPRARDPKELTWLRSGAPIEIAVDFELPQSIAERVAPRRFAHYELQLDLAGIPAIPQEILWLSDTLPSTSPTTVDKFPLDRDLDPLSFLSSDVSSKIVQRIPGSSKSAFFAEPGPEEGNGQIFTLGKHRSALANLPEDEELFPAALWVKNQLRQGVRLLALQVEAMRQSAPMSADPSLRSDGSNLPWVVHALESRDPERKRDWIAHVQTALPDIVDVRTVERDEDRHRYLLVRYENGLEAPSWLLSEGTLRLLALTLLAYAPASPGVLLIEEPENGLHPQAIETVFQSLSSIYDSQVFVASHSPILLSHATREQVLCFGRTPLGAVDIVSGDRHPDLANWHAALHLGDLLATGVLS
jgi:hypothetical protein